MLTYSEPIVVVSPDTFTLFLNVAEPVTVNVEFAVTAPFNSDVDVTANVLSNVVAPSTFNEPEVPTLPLPCCTVKLPCPTLNCVPSNVKLASSSNKPLVPAITTLLFVKVS